MKKQEMQERVTVDVDTTAVDTLSAELAAAVAPTNLDQAPVEELFDNEKKLDEELEVSETQIQAEGVQVASTDAAAAAMAVADASAESAAESGFGGGAAGAAAGISPLVWAGGALLTAGAIVVATDDDDDKSSGSSTPTPPPTPAPVDTVPVVAATKSVTVQEGKSVPITVVGTDADGDTLLYTPSNGANGTVTVSGQQNQFTYTPNAGFVGTDTFTVVVSDEDGNNVTQTITVTVTAAPLTVEDKTFDLTTAQDTVVGTAEGDTINAKYTNTGAGNSTLTAFDSIDGGAGVDTLNIFTDAATNTTFPANASVKDVEIINVNNAAAAGAFGDASKFVGATELNQIGGLAAAVTNLGSGTAAGFNGTNQAALAVTGAATAASATVNLTNASDANGATGGSAPVLNVNGAALNSVTVNGSILASAAGTAAAELALNVTVGTDVQALAVKTAVSSELTVTANGKAITSVDASASTGRVEYNAATTVASVKTGSGNDVVGLNTATTIISPAVNASLDSGAGNDTVTVTTTGAGTTTVALGDGNDTLTVAGRSTGLLTIDAGAGNDTIKNVDLLGNNTKTKIDGGAGTDTLEITNGGTLVAEDYVLLSSAVSNVEQLKFGAVVANADGSKLTQFSQLEFVGAGNNATKISAAQTVVGSGLDVTALGFVQATATTANTATGALNVVANGTGTIIADAGVLNLTVKTVAGGAAVTTTIGGASDFDTANVSLVSTENVNAAGVAISDNIADLQYVSAADHNTLVLTGEGTATVNNAGGELSTINSSGLSNTLFNGDIGTGLTFTGKAGFVESITVGAGKDAITVSSTYGSMDTLTGFDAVKETNNTKSVTDTLTFAGAALDGTAKNQATEVTLDATSTSLGLAFVQASGESTGAAQIQFFKFGGNTYLFQDTNGNKTLDDSDAALKVTGLVDFADDFAVFG
jgi:hypothetical protein